MRVGFKNSLLALKMGDRSSGQIWVYLISEPKINLMGTEQPNKHMVAQVVNTNHAFAYLDRKEKMPSCWVIYR